MFYIVKVKGHTVDMGKSQEEVQRTFKFSSTGTEMWEVQPSGVAKLLQAK